LYCIARTFAPPRILWFVFFTSLSSICIHFHLPQEKLSYRKIISQPWVDYKTQEFFLDLWVNFTTGLTVVNIPSAYWLSSLRTQIKCVLGQSLFAKHEIFLSTVFWNKFFAWSRRFKGLQLKCYLFHCPRIWTVTSLTYENKKVSANCLLQNMFSPKVIFVQSFHIFSILIRKCPVNLYCNWIWQNADT